LSLIAAVPVSTNITPLIADLHGDVSTGAGNHVDIPLHRQNLDLAWCRDLEFRRPRSLRARRCLSASTWSAGAALRVDADAKGENQEGDRGKRHRPATCPLPPAP
jgi:hypothetical protein